MGGGPYSTPNLPPMRRRALAVVLATAIAVVSLAGAALLAEDAPPSAPRHGAGLTTASPAVVHAQNVKTCGSLTTCKATTPINTVAYSSLYVVVSALSGSQPTAVYDNGHGFNFGSGVTGSPIASSVQGTSESVWVYRSDNVSVVSSEEITVNFSASTTYVIGTIDVANDTTSSLDAAGTGTSSTGATSVTASCTATVTNDYVLVGLGLGAAKTVTASGSATVLQTGGAQTDLVEQGAASGSISLGGTWTGSTGDAAVAVCIKSSLVPAAPTSLAAGTVTTTTIPLTWTHAIGPSVNVTLYQATYASGACGSYSGSSITAATGHTVTGLTSGTAYCFYITQWNSTGQGAASNVLTDVQTANVPAAATGLTVAAVSGSTTSLLASWSLPTKDTGIVNETVYVTSGSSCAGGPTTASIGLAQTYITGGLAAGTTYGTTVQIWNATGGSVQTPCVTAQTNAVPSAPTGLGVTATTTTTVGLAWTNPSGSLVNDTVDYGATCGTWIAQLSTGGAASSFTVTGLAPFTSYCFEVGAWTAGAEGALSSSQTDTTLTVVPGAPTSLSASPASTSSLTLTWTNPTISSGNLENNTVYYATSCASLTSKVSVGSAVQTYTLTGLSAATTYCIRVSAWTQAGEGARSNFANGTTDGGVPSAPTSLAYVSASRTSITLSWTNPGGSLVNDTLYWKAGSSCSTGATGISASVATTYTVGSLTAGTEYCFTVSAWSNGGQSADASAVTGFTQGATPPSPTGLVTFSIGTTWANIGWTNPSGYTLFNDTVYWKSSTCGPSWPNSHSAGAVTVAYNITGLTASSTYCVTVTAWDNQSAYSQPLFLNTSATASSGSAGPCPGGCPAGNLPAVQDSDSSALLVLVLSAGFIGILAAAALVLGGKRSRRPSRRRGR
jgi:hypothetical protein